MHIFMTGGAGCIGSEAVKYLLEEGNKVTVYDNLSSGRINHINIFFNNKNFKFIQGDILDKKKLKVSMKNVDVVWHLAANPDIRFNPKDPIDKDLKQNTIATLNILDCMNENDIKKILFSSTSAVYGEADILPIPENYGPIKPISLYGASKLACEGFITAFCHLFDMQAWIFRFGNVVGGKSRKKGTTAITDFINKLKKKKK